MALLTETEINDLLNDMKPMQIKFAELYVNRSLSAAEASVRAGYSKATRYVQSSRLLANDRIKQYVAHLKAVQAVEAEITAAQLIAELKPIAFQDIGDYIEVNEFGDVTVKNLEEVDTRAVKKISIKYGKGDTEGDVVTIELHDKLKATEMLGKSAEAFKDQLDITSGGEKISATTNIIDSKIIINHRRAGEKLEE